MGFVQKLKGISKQFELFKVIGEVFCINLTSFENNLRNCEKKINL